MSIAGVAAKQAFMNIEDCFYCSFSFLDLNTVDVLFRSELVAMIALKNCRHTAESVHCVLYVAVRHYF